MKKKKESDLKEKSDQKPHEDDCTKGHTSDDKSQDKSHHASTEQEENEKKN